MSGALALGTAQLGSPYGEMNKSPGLTVSQVETLLYEAKSAGISTIDTASLYPKSEELLGEVGTQGFDVITKLKGVNKASGSAYDWVIEEVEASLQRLNLPSLHAVLLHRPSDILGNSGQAVVAALKDLRQDGLIQHLGFSIYRPDELPSLCEAMNPQIIQCPFNVFDRRLETSGWLQNLANEKIEVHVRSVFLQGLLLCSRDTLPAKFAPWLAIWRMWWKFLDEAELTSLEASLNFVLGVNGVSKVVVGIDTPAQLNELLTLDLQRESLQVPDFLINDERLLNPQLWSDL